MWNPRGQEQTYFTNTHVTGGAGAAACPWSENGITRTNPGDCSGADDHNNYVLSPDPACGGSTEAIPIACIGKKNESDQKRVQELISYLESDNNQGYGTRNHAGSGFIYNTLTRHDAANNIGRSVSAADWNNLEKLIDEDLADGQITIWWNTPIESYYRTYGIFDNAPNQGDVAYYCSDSTCNHTLQCKNSEDANYACPQNDPAIIFRNAAGNPIYILYRPCGNPGGNMQGLPTPTTPPPPKVKSSCGGIQIDPGKPDPYTPFDVTATINYNTSGGAGSAFGPDTMYIKINGSARSYSTTRPTINSNGRSSTATYNVTVPALNTGSYTVETYSTGSVAPLRPGTCEQPLTITDQPYFSVTGGDVSVGAGMDVASHEDCSAPGADRPDDSASVVSWNQEAAGNYAGAGAQYAAFALDYLQDFASAQDGNGGTSSNPSKLAFANDPADARLDLSNGLFGGNFGGLDCMPDYFSGHPSSAPVQAHPITQADIAGATNIIYMQGNVKINALNVHNNTQTVVYVDGNVDIKGDINFSGSYAHVGEIPSFDLIVKGNIYIAPGVGQISGLYVAEPNVSGAGTPSDGIAYTCAETPYRTATTSPTDANTYLTNNLYTQCSPPNSAPLTVDGSLVARQVWLLRASGSLGSSAAENVNFSPEFWLNTPPETSADTYDAITSLPPVL
ncbi:MAG TPA: hypothetical protein VGG13_02195 [Candidatus Saccharimonadales bacterium]|jgi:hypothetical protein